MVNVRMVWHYTLRNIVPILLHLSDSTLHWAWSCWGRRQSRTAAPGPAADRGHYSGVRWSHAVLTRAVGEISRRFVDSSSINSPWTRCRSTIQTWGRSSGHRMGTRWCQSCTWTWRCQEAHTAWSPQTRPPRLSGMFHQTSRRHWMKSRWFGLSVKCGKIDVEIRVKCNYYKPIIAAGHMNQDTSK